MPESRWKMGRVVTGAFNTVDYSAASSTARETYSKGKRRSSPEVVVLANLVARDVRTTTGANLHFVRKVIGLGLGNSAN